MQKIDWPNHIIGFFSALFGILIAFELDEWKQAQDHQEDAAIAFEKLKQEIETNQMALHAFIEHNKVILDSLELELLPNLNDDLSFKNHVSGDDPVIHRYRPFFVTQTTNNSEGGSMGNNSINFQSMIVPSLQTSAWESAKATGVLNFMAYEKVLTVSNLYKSTLENDVRNVRELARSTVPVRSKNDLIKAISDLRSAHAIVAGELNDFDVFLSMLKAME